MLYLSHEMLLLRVKRLAIVFIFLFFGFTEMVCILEVCIDECVLPFFAALYT
jgi:hypothetical protein